MAKGGNPYHDPRNGQFIEGPAGSAGGESFHQPLTSAKTGSIKRWGKMSNVERAQLTARAQQKTLINKHTGKAYGKAPASVKSDERGYMGSFKYHQSPAAVAIQTSKALERDFHAKREKDAKASIESAIANYKGGVTKLPAGAKTPRVAGQQKPRKFGNKPRIHGYSTSAKSWR